MQELERNNVHRKYGKQLNLEDFQHKASVRAQEWKEKRQNWQAESVGLNSVQNRSINNSNANISLKIVKQSSGPPSIALSRRATATRPAPVMSAKTMAEDKVAKLKSKYQTIGDNITEENQQLEQTPVALTKRQNPGLMNPVLLRGNRAVTPNITQQEQA